MPYYPNFDLFVSWPGGTWWPILCCAYITVCTKLAVFWTNHVAALWFKAGCCSCSILHPKSVLADLFFLLLLFLNNQWKVHCAFGRLLDMAMLSNDIKYCIQCGFLCMVHNCWIIKDILRKHLRGMESRFLCTNHNKVFCWMSVLSPENFWQTKSQIDNVWDIINLAVVRLTSFHSLTRQICLFLLAIKPAQSVVYDQTMGPDQTICFAFLPLIRIHIVSKLQQSGSTCSKGGSSPCQTHAQSPVSTSSLSVQRSIVFSVCSSVVCSCLIFVWVVLMANNNSL